MANAWEAAPVVGDTTAAAAPKTGWQAAPIVGKADTTAAAPAEQPVKKAFGNLFDSPDSDPNHVSMADYLMDQAARAPGKALDFFAKGMSGLQDMPFDQLPSEVQKRALAANGGKPPNQQEFQLGKTINEKLLGKEPEAAGLGQAIAGAGAATAMTGGAGELPAIQKLQNMAKAGAFGTTQEGITQALLAIHVPQEYADKIAMAVTFGAGAGAEKLSGKQQQAQAEAAAVEKTKGYVQDRSAVNETVDQKTGGTPQDVQAAAQAAKAQQTAALDARGRAATSIENAANRHVEDTIATFQPNTTFGEIAQKSLSDLNDTVRTQVKAQAQGTLQKVADTPRVDAGPALALARKIEKDFAGRDAVADSAGGVASNILSNTKENLGKTNAPVGSGKISSTLSNKITTDSAMLDGKTAHNIIGDINDRIEGKGKYASESTPDVANLLAVKKALIAAIDKSSNGAYSQYLGDYAQGMAKLDPFQRGLAADKVTADLDYGRSKTMGPGQAAETLLPKGAKGADVATRIQSLMKDDPNFQISLKSYVGQQLSDMKASLGGLTPKKFEQFQKDYGPALKAYGLDKSLSTVQDAVQAAGVREAEINAIRKSTENQRQQYESSAVSKIAGVAESSMVLDPIMGQSNRSDRMHSMRSLVQAVKNSPNAAAATNGLKTKFNQYFFDHPDKSEDLAEMAEKSGLYPPAQAQAIRKVADAIRGENAQKQAQRMVKGGMPELDGKSAVASYITNKVGFILLSTGIGKVAGGAAGGLATGGVALAGQNMLAKQKQMTIDAIAKIIEDPAQAKLMAERATKANGFMADHIARAIAAQVVKQTSPGQDQGQQ